MVIVAEIGSLTAGTAAAGLSFILIVMVSMPVVDELSGGGGGEM